MLNQTSRAITRSNPQEMAQNISHSAPETPLHQNVASGLRGSGLPDNEASRSISAWLARRPEVQDESCLASGGLLLRYGPDHNEAMAPRNEALFTHTSGLLAAVLTVHPQVEQRARMPLTAGHIASQLAAPPFGLLTGIWQAADGNAFIERNGHLHQVNEEGHWMPLPVGGHDASLRMIGRQADGNVYLHDGKRILRAGNGPAAFHSTRLPAGAIARIDATGALRILHKGQLMTATNHGQTVRDISLLRPVTGGTGFEPTPARPIDLLLLPHPHSAAALVLDEKGRAYQAELGGQGSIEARRLTLPEGMSHAEGWAITSMGLSSDNAVHLLLENGEGHRVALQKTSDQTEFQPAWLVDHPLLLIKTEGLHTHADEAMQSRTLLDGHAQLGHINGVLHYKSAPGQHWERPSLPDGEPLTDILSLHTGVKGFVDRRPVFALLDNPQRLAELKLPGRTTWLPAGETPSHPAGGPLAIIPDRVQVRAQTIAHFDEGVRDVAIDAGGQVAVLTESGHLKRFNANGEVSELPALAHPLSIAIGLDDRLHVLSQSPDHQTKLQRLTDNGQWENVPLTLPESHDLPGALRSSRTGQLQLQFGHNWHTLLPSMTGPDARRIPSRVAPQATPDEKAVAGTQSGTNARVNYQQASRISTPDHDVSVNTTLLGSTSTDPLSLNSNIHLIANTYKSQAIRMANIVRDVAHDTTHAVAHKMGIALPPTPQEKRLARFHQEADQLRGHIGTLFETLPVLAEVRVASAIGPGQHDRAGLTAAQGEHLIAMRENELASLLRDLRKIGYHEGVIAADFSTRNKPGVESTSSNFSYHVAELWRRVSSGITRATSRPGNDVLPDFDRSISSLARAAADNPQTLSGREAELLTQLCEVSGKLKASGVQLSADEEQSKLSSRPNALRTACLLNGLAEYDTLLRTNSAAELEQADSRQKQSGLRGLARLGLSSWSQLEAFDDVVSTFRQQITTPGNGRRAQLLKSLNLPKNAAPDEMASRMTDLLQDLFNRSTFFSSQSRSAELRGSLGAVAWKYINPVSAGVGGEAIHALGVERIGDSKDGDAGLVAFFVRHAKATASGSLGIGIDFKPGAGSGSHAYLNNSSMSSYMATWGGSANVNVGGSYQHGMGAAVILSPSTIPEFSRLLFDHHDTETTNILHAGVNEGSIGLDLFETNVNASANLNVSVQPFAASSKYGSQKPHAASEPAGPGNLNSSISGAVAGGITGQIGGQWSQMELHLDHAWQEILGLEFQGRINLNAELNGGVNLASGLSSVLGRNFSRLVNAATGAGNLQLAGVRLNSSDVQLPTSGIYADKQNAPLLGTASYKRTLDTKAAHPVSPDEWQQMRQRLASVFPESAADLGPMHYPATSAERIAVIMQAIKGIQGEQASSIEARGAIEGDALKQQRALAEEATSRDADRLWKGGTKSERAAVVTSLQQLRQQETTAVQQRARLIPGARIEINMFGRESLDAVMSHAIGHIALGEKMRDLTEVRRQIPGLNEVLRRFKDIPKINQVRFVFEMRPQAMNAINDALEAKVHQQSASALGLSSSSDGMDWRSVLNKTQHSPDLYRLAALAVHNTDDNSVINRVGLPLVNLTASAGTSHQMFEAEIQFHYDLYDRIQGAEVLEAGGRALRQSLNPLRSAGIEAIGQHRAGVEARVAEPESPRGESSRSEIWHDIDLS
ncbi:AvrE-family type 3 secretion system effector [Erwinia psidii]|uniref:Transducer protein car n=1 Tax=Erwinia psidii TaxID=69224 RepID=A0A3N6TTY0_9GAMM|nr:AvrE-family type 3 secretion system effector [Erwinia psidii]MCX8956025.1 transducer protein car [Erwinia psidii]RQM38732.1 transducer protein car [Erwinia psidii]